jgi:hypothetical protein
MMRLGDSFAQNGMALVHNQRRTSEDPVDVDRRVIYAADRGARAEGQMDRSHDLFVLEDLAAQSGCRVGADAEFGDPSTVGASGIEGRQQPIGRRARGAR